jgi:hypothetical protein
MYHKSMPNVAKLSIPNTNTASDYPYRNSELLRIK